MNVQKNPVRLLALILFCVLAFLGNWLKFEIFFGIDFLSGSLFVMLAIMVLGSSYGAIAGFVAGTCTYLLWNHPWAIPIMTCEALFVACLYSKRKGNPVIYDIAYWVCIGMPMVYFIYHCLMGIEIQGTLLIMFKQTVNGIFNTLLAVLVYMVFRLRKRSGGEGTEYFQLIFVVMVSLVLLPAMLFLITGARSYQEREMEVLESKISYLSEIARNSLAKWIEEHQKAVETLATLVGDPDSSSFAVMQHYVETIKAATPAYRKLGVLNRESITVAYSPLEEDGKSTLSIDFSDRPFIPVMKESKKPLIPDVVIGKHGKPSPVVLLLAPIIIAGEYRGYCNGVVEPSRISGVLSSVAAGSYMNITVVDGNEMVIASTIPGLKIMDRFLRPYLENGRTGPSGILHWISDPKPNTSILQRWKGSLLVKSILLSPDCNWRIIVEAPYLPLIEHLSRYSILRLAFLIVLILFTVTLSYLFSRGLVSTIIELQDVTRFFPNRLEDVAGIQWPKSKITELAVLSGNFRDMASALVVDITERERIERHLRKSEEQFRTLVEGAPDAIFIVIKGRLAYVNEAAVILYGAKSEQDLLGQPVVDRLHPDSLRAGIERLRVLNEERKPVPMLEQKHLKLDGTVIDLEVSSVPFIYREERGALVFARNITERIKMEEALRLTYFSIENASESVFWIDPDARFIFVNEAATRQLGYTKEDLLSMTLYDIDPIFRPDQWRHCREVLKKDHSLTLESLHRCRNGHTIPVEITANYVEYKGKEYVFSFSRDISDRKRAEEKWLQLHQQNRLILDAAGEGIVGLDPAGDVVFANPAATAIIGFPIEELVGANFHHLVRRAIHDQDHHEEDCIACKTLHEGIAHHMSDDAFWRKDGRIVPVSFATTPIIENGEMRGAVITFRDIAKRKRAEEAKAELEAQLAQAQKMEAIGTLAGGIAHDFNNILYAIIGYADMSLASISESDPLKHPLEQILHAGSRATDLVKRILAFSRMKTGENRQPHKIGPLVKEVLQFLRAIIPSTIEIRQNIVDDEAVVLADSTQIHQMITNLCTNAAHAMEESGGVVEVELVDVEIDSSSVYASLNLDPGSYLRLSIRDNGHGMDSGTQQRIFDPYFTTKEQGKGTGLGLSVVHGIVEGHGGAITVHSEPGKGTGFDIYLPKIQGEPVSAEPDVSPLPRGTERILLVDDEESLVDVGRAILESLGYEVAAAANGAEALEIFRKNPDHFDLVITDYTMPKMTGADLATEVMHMRPGIRVILCTGYTERITRKQATELGIRELLMKPLDMRRMAHAVRKVLDGE
jgi:two-component system, cell cycle sensor histidine kinase and response regulator CckA